MSADVINMNKKVIKRGKKKLSDRKQCELVYNELLFLTEELSNKVSVPNMIESIQHFVSDLAYDTAPSSSLATSMLLGVINHKLGHVIEKELEEELKNE